MWGGARQRRYGGGDEKEWHPAGKKWDNSVPLFIIKTLILTFSSQPLSLIFNRCQASKLINEVNG